jgi:hypothetical protein
MLLDLLLVLDPHRLLALLLDLDMAARLLPMLPLLLSQPLPMLPSYSVYASYAAESTKRRDVELDLLMHPPLLLMNPTVAFALGVAYTRNYAAGGTGDATGPYILGLLRESLAMDLYLLLMDPLVLVVLLVEMLLYLAL